MQQKNCVHCCDNYSCNLGREMIKLLVIADDFTGALDTGVQFSKKGIPVLVSTKADFNLELIDSDIQVLVVDAGSRHIRPAEAAERVRGIAARAKNHGVEYVYKKTDSTLRGNIGSELTALMNVYDCSELMFVPAFPKTGRTTINGFQYVNGLPVHETAFAKDPMEPIKNSFIPDIIKRQSDVDVCVVNRDSIEKFRVFEHDNKIIFVFDAENDEDLARIGSALKKANKLAVTAGCAGFAEFLPELLKLESKAVEETDYNSNMLVVCGSINESSLKQIRFAERHGFGSITLKCEEKLQKGYADTADGQKLIEEIVLRSGGGAGFIIKTVNDRQEADNCDDFARKLNIDTSKVPLVIARNLGRIVKQVLNQKDVGTIVVFGGDTAMEIMNALGCRGIRPRKEIVPGVAISEVMSDKYKVNLVSKAGGFGNENVLLEIKKFLEGGK